MGGQYGAMAICVKLGATSSAKNLHHVQDSKVNNCTLLGIVDLGALK